MLASGENGIIRNEKRREERCWTKVDLWISCVHGGSPFGRRDKHIQ